MSKAGLEVAVKYGEKLNEFNSMADAESYFFEYKDSLLSRFENICTDSKFNADYSVDSLKTLEKWYFELWEKDDFASFAVSRAEFEEMLTVYFDEVAVRNIDEAQWEVMAYPFVNGKYELGLKCGLMNLAGLGHFRDLCTMQGNKRRNFISREYKKYFDTYLQYMQNQK